MVFELGHLTVPAPRADQWYPSLCCNEMMLRLRLLHLMLGTISTANLMDDPEFDPWVGKIPWRRERLPTPVFWAGEFQELE